MLTIAWAGHDALGVQRCVSEGVGTGAIKLAGAWSCARSRAFKARVWAGHDALDVQRCVSEGVGIGAISRWLGHGRAQGHGSSKAQTIIFN